MSGFIDTNILLYAANGDAAEHGAARAFLLGTARSADAWYVSEGVVYEFLRVATHPRVFPRPLSWQEALAFVGPLVAADNVYVLRAGDDHWALIDTVLAALTHPSGNLFFDVRTVVLMREHGVRRVYTTDTDFLQFAGIEVINPLRG